MKKIYLFLLAAVFCTASFGQSGVQSLQKTMSKKSGKLHKSLSNDRPTQSEGLIQSRAEVLWEDDFSDPSNWEMDNESEPPVDWVISTDPMAPVEPNNCSECLPINTPTVGNGYAWIDADSQGEGSTQNSSIRTVNPVDLSDETAVALSFYCVTRNYASTYTVRVSPDNGGTWVDYPVLEQITTNVNTENPELVNVNITSVAAGASEVLIEFNFTADWGWWWAIDDVSLVIPENNDLLLESTSYGYFDFDDGDTWETLEYSNYQVDQVRPLTIGADVSNVGGLDQTNVRLEATISDGVDYTETLESAPITIAPGEMMSLSIPDYIPPAVAGTYTISYVVLQDSTDFTPENNVGSHFFMISDDVFARDRGIVENWYIIDEIVFDIAGLGNGFFFTADGEIHCVGAAFTEETVVGDNIFFSAFIRDNTFTPVATSGEFSTAAEGWGGIVLNDLDGDEFSWIDMDPFVVEAGDEFVVSIEHEPLQPTSEDVVIGLSGSSPEQTAYIWGPPATEGICDPCIETNTPMVRIGMSEEFCLAQSISSAVEELEEVSISSIFPNPTVGQTTLEYSVIEESEVQIFLFDNNGRIMMQEDKGTQPVGEYRFDYDFSDLASGNYTMSIMVGDKAVNKKLMIK